MTMPPSANFGLRVPLRVLLDPDLKPDEKLLYGFIASVPNNDPSYAQISAALGFSPKRTARALRALDGAGWIRSKRAPWGRIDGRVRRTGTTKHEVSDGGRQFILMPPERRQQLVQALSRQSRSSLMLVALYEQHMAARGRPRPTYDGTSNALGISRRAVARATARIDTL
jgi:helix-turn-helix protein